MPDFRPPERVKEAERQLATRLMQPGPLVLDAEDQIGPVPIKKAGDA